MKIVPLLSVVCLSCLLCPKPATSAPEYMKLKLAIGQAFEIEGRWDSANHVFIAKDIEALPQPRRPKLRGAIQKVDQPSKTLIMYNLPLRVTKETEFLGDNPGGGGFEVLKAGMRIEVTCKVDSGNQWMARKISWYDIKSSDKVKGTVTQMSVDGVAPDTLDLDGLKILLTTETDVVSASGSIEQREINLFHDLGYQEILGVKDGMIIGDKITLAAEYRQAIRSKSDYSLTKSYASDESLSLFDARVSSLGYWSSNLRTEAQLRFRTDYVLSSDTNRTSSNISGRILRLNVLLKDIGARGLALQVGRQNFVEPREWLFDEYLDAVRMYYYGASSWQVQGAVIHGINPIKPKYKTWTDIFGMVDWLVNPDNTISVYFLSRADSDTTRDITSGELRKREPVWWGIRWMGKPTKGIKGWTDLAIMRGTDKQKTLRAWAFDAGASYTVRSTNIRPTISMGYAIGSGDNDKGDDVDHRFRQTGYQDNTNSLGGKASFAYYGAVLRPELSNLVIFTLSASARPITESSVQLVYHSYRQREVYARFTNSDLVSPPALPNGSSDDIGWALDAVISAPKMWDHFRFSLVLGMFSPGIAYAPRLDKAFLSQLSIEAAI
jgi:alginate production protein